MRTQRPERLATFSYLGPHQYFLTFCTFERRRLFEAADGVEVARTHILRAARDCGFSVPTYCFMPDHVHLLVQGERTDSDCRRFISLAKQLTGFAYRQRFGGRLWQRYGYEHTLRSDEAALSVARYIVENPVRAGLVQDARAYPFTGSERWTIEEIVDAVCWAR
jgi:putative transposase